jgi:hypothetical protein
MVVKYHRDYASGQPHDTFDWCMASDQNGDQWSAPYYRFNFDSGDWQDGNSSAAPNHGLGSVYGQLDPSSRRQQ